MSSPEYNVLATYAEQVRTEFAHPTFFDLLGAGLGAVGGFYKEVAIAGLTEQQASGFLALDLAWNSSAGVASVAEGAHNDQGFGVARDLTAFAGSFYAGVAGASVFSTAIEAAAVAILAPEIAVAAGVVGGIALGGFVAYSAGKEISAAFNTWKQIHDEHESSARALSASVAAATPPFFYDEETETTSNSEEDIFLLGDGFIQANSSGVTEIQPDKLEFSHGGSHQIWRFGPQTEYLSNDGMINEIFSHSGDSYHDSLTTSDGKLSRAIAGDSNSLYWGSYEKNDGGTEEVQHLTVYLTPQPNTGPNGSHLLVSGDETVRNSDGSSHSIEFANYDDNTGYSTEVYTESDGSYNKREAKVYANGFYSLTDTQYIIGGNGSTEKIETTVDPSGYAQSTDTVTYADGSIDVQRIFQTPLGTGYVHVTIDAQNVTHTDSIFINADGSQFTDQEQHFQNSDGSEEDVYLHVDENSANFYDDIHNDALNTFDRRSYSSYSDGSSSHSREIQKLSQNGSLSYSFDLVSVDYDVHNTKDMNTDGSWSSRLENDYGDGLKDITVESFIHRPDGADEFNSTGSKVADGQSWVTKKITYANGDFDNSSNIIFGDGWTLYDNEKFLTSSDGSTEKLIDKKNSDGSTYYQHDFNFVNGSWDRQTRAVSLDGEIYNHEIKTQNSDGTYQHSNYHLNLDGSISSQNYSLNSEGTFESTSFDLNADGSTSSDHYISYSDGYWMDVNSYTDVDGTIYSGNTFAISRADGTSLYVAQNRTNGAISGIDINGNDQAGSYALSIDSEGAIFNEYMTAADGSDLSPNVLVGGSFSVLTGTSGSDIIAGKGNNVMQGGAGSDIYLYARGAGADEITEINDDGYDFNRLIFADGINADQLWFTQNGNDLLVNVIGTEDSLEINDWYSGTSKHIQQFISADGKALTDSQVDNLVSAMAAFSPPSAGQTSLPQSYQDSLASVIAVNWS